MEEAKRTERNRCSIGGPGGRRGSMWDLGRCLIQMRLGTLNLICIEGLGLGRFLIVVTVAVFVLVIVVIVAAAPFSVPQRDHHNTVLNDRPVLEF